MSAKPCPYCGETGRERDTDRDPRPVWVCAGCGLTWEEARQMLSLVRDEAPAEPGRRR